MIKHEVVVPNIGLSKKLSAAKVETTADNIVMDRKHFICFGGNFHCDSSDTLFLTLIYKSGLNIQ